MGRTHQRWLQRLQRSALAEENFHNLHVERFYKAQVINGLIAPAGGDGPIKTPVLRGIKDTPTYFHDGRLMTLDDSVEFFNLILGTKLTTQEKKDLVAFMLTL
jgi:cytochrome c peroxidase